MRSSMLSVASQQTIQDNRRHVFQPPSYPENNQSHHSFAQQLRRNAIASQAIAVGLRAAIKFQSAGFGAVLSRSQAIDARRRAELGRAGG
jgi:hypothetical protein